VRHICVYMRWLELVITVCHGVDLFVTDSELSPNTPVATLSRLPVSYCLLTTIHRWLHGHLPVSYTVSSVQSFLSFILPVLFFRLSASLPVVQSFHTVSPHSCSLFRSCHLHTITPWQTFLWCLGATSIVITNSEKKVRTSICIARTVYYTPLMRCRHWTNRQAGQATAHSLHTQVERSGPTTGHGQPAAEKSPPP